MAGYLVTGGCGFIGSHLVSALHGRGDTVRVLDDLSTGRRENLVDGVELIVGDIGDRAAVADAATGVDGCFHLAAVASVERSRLDWCGTHRTNQSGLVNLLDAVRPEIAGRAVPVIYASSAAVYGDNPSVPLGEDSVAKPLSAYGADKLGCELHARVGAVVHGVPTVGFRFFNVFGPRQDPASPYSGAISIFARRLLDGHAVTVFGDGEQVRDFVYVADVVEFLLAAMDDRPSGAEVFNVCTGNPTSINGLLRLLGEIISRTPEVSHAAARLGDIRRSIGDATRVRARFPASGPTDLRDGLAATVAWMKEAGG